MPLNDDDQAALDQQQTMEDFDPEHPETASGASDTLIAKHLREQEQRAARRKDGPGFLTRAFRAVTALPRATVRHIADHWAEIGFITAAGAGAAYGIGVAAGQPDASTLNNAFAMAALSYPIWGILRGMGGSVGYTYGHYRNWRNGDRFNEIRAKAFGRAAGMTAAAGVIAFGGLFGMNYVEGLKYTALNAPTIVGKQIPSAAINAVAPQYNNTKWDPLWKLEDQPNCLYREIREGKAGQLCVRGPGAEKLELRVQP
jgi:hypothetical protein